MESVQSGKTSKALHIHRNTLVYRLEKLQEMLPERLKDFYWIIY